MGMRVSANVNNAENGLKIMGNQIELGWVVINKLLVCSLVN